jgi:hypothetical protein
MKNNLSLEKTDEYWKEVCIDDLYFNKEIENYFNTRNMKGGDNNEE